MALFFEKFGEGKDPVQVVRDLAGSGGKGGEDAGTNWRLISSTWAKTIPLAYAS